MSRKAKPAPAIEGGHAPLSSLPGIGPQSAEKLAAHGLGRVSDLWFWLPRDYQDRTRLTPIHALRNGVAAQVEGRVLAVDTAFRARPMLKVLLGDERGSTVTLKFFHFRKQQADAFRQGGKVRAYGVPRPGQAGLEMAHPSYRVLGDGDAPLDELLEPVYPQIDGIGAALVRKIVSHALRSLPGDAALELLPEGFAHDMGLPGLRQALLYLHHPPADADVAALQSGRHPAQRRLVLEEMLAHHLSLRRERVAMQRHAAAALPRKPGRVEQLLAALPFQLTGAQARVLAEVERDLEKPVPMLRLVQGDVGSGKTVVAALAALRAIDAGHQVALMAPTELLAEQHLASLRGWLEPLGVRIGWLAGKVTGKARAQVLAEVATGEVQLIIGTHALMQEGVEFADLALAIIDEQHRFGVQQRLALRDKGSGLVPHQLVMTATPIPRTLAMSAYADLDVSVIDELPAGRRPVQTVVISNARRDELIARIRAVIAEGRQAYWVCTLIEEQSEGEVRIDAQAAETTFVQLQQAMPELRIALVHGRMKPQEKQAAMAAFKLGESDLLVSTTVIEVGVDVPNASLMIIENAERLGLAQLHQLRGRVGRGSVQSSCVLLYQPPLGKIARQRLDMLRHSNDGFLIAEKDLELRGPGELLGVRQTGLAQLRIADLMRDADLLPQVEQLASQLLRDAPENADAIIARWIGSALRYASA
ncbi:ATP-dependent DNA helicase RecG [Lysobacteraceae bacterium NML75-0749]|nr:ATP-dependent DNA helicase RecG [Xanthomonadaceae bacterium NML75-0749]PJK04419.1 ATP-dependent DNA helicase RecG [Xanthomonadaceae bacterium NML91-0268]